MFPFVKKPAVRQSIPRLDIHKLGTYEDYLRYSETMVSEHLRRSEVENTLFADRPEFLVDGRCYICQESVRFQVDLEYAAIDGQKRVPNWREKLVCRRCGLRNRKRAAIHIFEQECAPLPASSIYLTEQQTELYRWANRNYRVLTGSEYLGQTIPFGASTRARIRNESLTKLTFPNDSFDFILSFDVFEHIPEYGKGFAECLRCLKPGGTLIFSVPFGGTLKDNRVRARLGLEGQVEHILPAEYHGDPLNSAGCLCFYHFGWQLLEELRTLGFADVEALFYWSREWGYLGRDQILFRASKPT